MKTLFAAFGGRHNSSQTLLSLIDCPLGDKLLLKNSFKSAPAALCEQLTSDQYDLALLFGQRKMFRNRQKSQRKTPRDQRSPKSPSPKLRRHQAEAATTVRLETVGLNSRVAFHTEVNFAELAKRLTAAGLDPIISKDAGRYLCNNLYFQAMKYADESSLKTKILFIHIPKLRENPDLEKIATALVQSLDERLLSTPDP